MTGFDPVTSSDQGPELVGLLGQRLLPRHDQGDGHAAALHSACVRDQVTAFLLDPTKPPPKTSCPAE